ncbi:2-succinyl-5-enolpyruvyl-6-hydroxy-3-cyclohexene-1-carboxylic-acid synthase [Vibrio ulleungensis]|uniref:2-succinyl-5-enolpyruvyl-6-hydroxy-3-cyclohexene-1-carboxylate synthase n=1 Tax=Vibrio ulleungensis TaxID=2807619 RepID=A0ABS2HGH4_9VIBR|nr:2-succinyl-5-enolpyruvyl-6-hydroxy-3-cyclohexene-1-carboxylic-acid synthase [Vibrio ulleungensis]MBM7036643.1 2-succinyl-5-enolpyruvyl-6-hydroxy-3-cyclohexene-1-carboxylic-acid synthase [Vibrio ulleungensis]
MNSTSYSQAAVNRVWARQLFRLLEQFGVRHACIAPGSRSTPLTLEAQAIDSIDVHTHFDERGLGFMALGMAKVHQAPIAIVVTSGTAVANLLPAVAEANLTGEKLVILTADRPPELIGIGANQAIVQQGLFSSHVTEAVDLPCPTIDALSQTLIHPVREALLKQQNKGGAIHLNCPFREPLYVDDEADVDALFFELPPIETVSRAPRNQSPDAISLKPQGLVIIGSLSLKDAQKAKQFAQRLGWPVLCDIQSGVSSEFSGYDVWLPLCRERAFSNVMQVVQFGARVVSKRLNQWLVEQHQLNASFDYHVVTSDWRRCDPNRLSATQHHSDIGDWIDLQSYQTTSLSEYLLEKHAAAQLLLALDTHSQTQQSINEVGLAHALSQLSPHWDLFVGNSLIVRLMDMYSRLNDIEVYSNRGASGIDGLVATASGVAQLRARPMVTVVGDTSMLYDLNSLARLSSVSTPSVIVVVNNDGGAIFDMLPVDPVHREKLYQMPHGLQFNMAAKMFGLDYAKPKTVQSLLARIEQHLDTGSGALLIEAMVEPGQAKQHIATLKNTLAQTLHESN